MKAEEWIRRYNAAFAQADFEQDFWARRLGPKQREKILAAINRPLPVPTEAFKLFHQNPYKKP